jgi:predicted amidophosphoribosyltransferase
MRWRPLLDVFFPPQCASCNAFGAGLCSNCARWGEAIHVRLPGLAVTALGAYESGLRAAVLALKDGRRDVAEALGAAVVHLIKPQALLVPIPTTAKRRRVRGIDGVALVAEYAAAIAGAAVVPALQLRSGDAQRGRSRVQRLAARGRFACDAASIANTRVLLFDDVCTTGSTLRDGAAALREAGGLVEHAVVIAVAKSGDPWREPART